MPVAPRRPEDLCGKVFRVSVAVAAGRLSPREPRSPAWRRLFRDVYACADLPVTHELRALAVARLLVPASAISGRSAAVLWAFRSPRDDDVELTVPAGANVCRMPGLRVRRRTLEPAELTVRRGASVTTPEVTAIDLAREGTLDDAVVLFDRFVEARVTNLERLRVVAAGVSGRGCRQVRRALELADGLAGSPPETRLRLVLHRSTLPNPVAQFTVRDAAGLVARVDFGWPDVKVAVEYEGAWHGESRQQVAADRRRLNRLTAAGWTVVFVTAADLHDPEALLARIAAALVRASVGLSSSQRG